MGGKLTAIAAKDERQVNLWPYVAQFGVIYFVATVAAAVVLEVIQHVFGLGTDFPVSIGTMIAAAVIPVRRFVLDHRRPFSRHEQLRFAFLALVAVLVVDLVLFALGYVVLGKL